MELKHEHCLIKGEQLTDNDKRGTECELKLILKPAYVQCGGGQEDVCGLGYVGGVQAVVVGHVRVIVALQGQHECHKAVRWNLERPHQVSLLHATEREGS